MVQNHRMGTPTTDKFQGKPEPFRSQCFLCSKPTVRAMRWSVDDEPRLQYKCPINQYAPLVTWNCPSFEREPGVEG